MMSRPPYLEWIVRDDGADVLVVTNMWPEPDKPVYGIFVKRQVESLQAAGVRVDVLYLRGYVSPRAYLIGARAFASATWRMRGRYRLVHVHAGETALAARFMIGPPLVVSYCGDDVLGDPDDSGAIPFVSRLRAAVIRGHAALASATITKSQEMHDRLPRAVRRTNSVIPNGVDQTLFRPYDRLAARRELGWADDEYVVLFAATKPDIPRKRRWLAEAACAEAASRLGSVRLHVSGLTAPDEMPRLMNAADCLLHTAALEGSPNVVKEALMCNLPVVATPSGDIPWLLDGVEPSWICPADPNALADALVDCLESRPRSNGHETWVGRLSADAVAERVLAIYDAIGRAARGDGQMQPTEVAS